MSPITAYPLVHIDMLNKDVLLAAGFQLPQCQRCFLGYRHPLDAKADTLGVDDFLPMPELR